MKKKIVLWGSDENDNKMLLALELLAKENQVKLYTFPEEIATEAFYNSMMDDWREEKEVEFPDGHKVIERPLSMTEDLLPEEIKVQRGDVINRAKTEWHFIVLSTKLYELYKSELEDFRERIARLSEFDNGLFEELKGFWSKVSDQARDRNLFREHTDKLKEITNDLFGQMKELRKKANAELSRVSEENKKKFAEQLETIEAKMDKGLGLKPIFEELKKLQSEFKNEKFTREDRNSLWQRIDKAFKKFKEKKYGDQGESNSRSSRLQRRYDGLLNAIEKMERSISRDEKDIAFQNKRVDKTQGQLELQIRQAKIKMIEERISSKREKLDDMLKTRTELEQRLDKERRRQEKEQVKQEVKKKAETVKAKIADEISQKSEIVEENAAKLAEAAKAINAQAGKKGKGKESGEGLVGKLKEELSEAVEDIVDTVKAASEVLEDNLEDKLDNIKADLKEAGEKYKVEEKIKEVKQKAEALKETVEEKIEEMVDSISGEEE